MKTSNEGLNPKIVRDLSQNIAFSSFTSFLPQNTQKFDPNVIVSPQCSISPDFICSVQTSDPFTILKCTTVISVTSLNWRLKNKNKTKLSAYENIVVCSLHFDVTFFNLSRKLRVINQ